MFYDKNLLIINKSCDSGEQVQLLMDYLLSQSKNSQSQNYSKASEFNSYLF